MSRRLAAAVHIQHPVTRDWIILEPGDEPDDDLAAEITNPDAWEPVAADEPGPDLTEPDEPEPEPVELEPVEPEPEPTAPRRRRKPTDAGA
ncbi:hypothetical protein ACFVIM_00675 [Streptomyces sp. NPDC057638]|uniref:hypothetical protein n=1 Tax=Streptomyces sp. NPDC057638 TaxID=3346190 RepID=UPI0036BEBEAC